MKGGEWLGAARDYIQREALNGDSISWGSDEVVKKQFTMREIEEFAAIVAAAALNEKMGVRSRKDKFIEEKEIK